MILSDRLQTTGTCTGVRLLVAALAFLALSLISGQAMANCGKPRPLQLKVAVDFPEPEIIHDFDSADIPERSRKVERRVAELSSRLNGLTVFQMESGYQMSVQQNVAGGNCFSLTGLDVWINVKRLRVYIARELEIGSCEHEVTLQHEHNHVNIYRDGVNRLQQRWADAAESSVIRQPIRASDADAALERFASAIATIFSDIRQQETQRMTRKNALLDTPSAYRAEQRRCHDQ